MNFADRLDAAVRAKQSPCLLGLDPHLDLLPPQFARATDAREPRSARAALLADFCCELIDLAADRVPAVKPQSAFFEIFGADGAVAWERVIAHAHSRGLLVVADVKRGDIATTARAYALAHLASPDAPHPGGADAVTINPYLGTDALEPFIEVCRERDAGAFVLVRTSNPGSARYQLDDPSAHPATDRATAHPSRPTLAERVAADVSRLGESLRGACGWSSLGAVVGATHPAELARWRASMPHTLFLLPGYGAQGATARDIAPAFTHGTSGALVASSRGIAFAYRGAAGAATGTPAIAATGATDITGASRAKSAPDWRSAADRALDAMLEDLSGALGARHG